MVTAEHASPALPEGLDLGVPLSVLRSHVGYDEGAGEAAEEIASRGGVPLHVGRFSRLLVDLNRSEANPEVIPAVTFGVRIPGNEGLTPEERSERLDRWWRPHREAVGRAVKAAIRAAGHCLHLAVHSFESDLDPARRAFDVGVLFDPERSFERTTSGSIVSALLDAGLSVRENQPYRGTDDGLTTALRRIHQDPVYAGLEIELSRSLVREPSVRGQALDALARALGLR